MTKTYLPRDQRQAISFCLTERDIEILKAVNRYRYMRTSQVWRLIFPDNKTTQAPTRRLKYLYHNGFLSRIQPLMRPGQGSGEMCYHLAREGEKLLQECDEKVRHYNKSGTAKHIFLQHALDLSEFRVNLELALKESQIARLHRFVCDFEIKEKTDSAIGKYRYKLYHECIHPLTRERFVVYPDGLIVLHGVGKYEEFQTLYFLEIDRGTESLSRIRDKVIGYELYRQNNIFKKFGEFKRFKVLLQTNSKKRAENIRKHLIGQAGEDLIWVTYVDQVEEHTIVKAPIWVTHLNEATSIFKYSEGS